MEVDLAFQMIVISLFTIFCFLVRFMIALMIWVYLMRLVIHLHDFQS